MMWRIRSRSHWEKLGDAPSTYFFQLVVVKRMREMIKVLVLPNGRVTEDEQEILQEVFRSSRTLYARDQQVALNKMVRSEILELVDKFFSAEDNEILKAIPQEEKINRVVFAFPRGKSPGEDGVIYDFVQDSWGLVGEGCRAMVQDFWADARLSSNTMNDIVKMVPNGYEMLENLDFCQNLTMLTTTYKIISKILTERLKPMILHLVDRQRTGFVKGCYITDNLLTWKLGHEHAKATNQDILCVKLDFAKAYDKIDHSFF